MYYIYGISGPSLLIESTDSMIRGISSFLLYTCITVARSREIFACTLYLISRLLQLLQRVTIEGPGSAGGETESTLSAVALTQPLVPAS